MAPLNINSARVFIALIFMATTGYENILQRKFPNLQYTSICPSILPRQKLRHDSRVETVATSKLMD